MAKNTTLYFNHYLSPKNIKEKILEDAFENRWPDFEFKLNELNNSFVSKGNTEPVRDTMDILTEILESIREIRREKIYTTDLEKYKAELKLEEEKMKLREDFALKQLENERMMKEIEMRSKLYEMESKAEEQRRRIEIEHENHRILMELEKAQELLELERKRT